MTLPESLQNAIRAFRDSLDDKLYHVEHDIDMDGFASGIITTVALRRLGFEAYPYAVRRGKTFVPDSGALVLTDIALNNEPTETVDRAIEKGVHVYAIDHHPWTPGYERKLHAKINPHYIPDIPKPSQWNAGFLAYITFRDLVPDLGWLAAVSAYTDTCIEPWSRSLVDLYGLDRVKKAGDILTAVIATIGDLSELDYMLLNEIHGIGDVLTNDAFLKAYGEFNTTVTRYVENPQQYALLWDNQKKIMVIETKEPYLQINSVVSTRISLFPEYRDWIIAVIARNPDEEGYKVSLRCQDWKQRGHMGELARMLAEKLGGAGGGHPPAAGMRIPKEKKEAFVEILKDVVARA